MFKENCLGQASKDLPQIWFKTLRNAMKVRDGGDRSETSVRFPCGFRIFHFYVGVKSKVGALSLADRQRRQLSIRS